METDLVSAAPTAASLPHYDPDLIEAVHSLISELRHEIGNPLNSIKAALTLLRRGIATYPLEKSMTYLEATLSEVARLERLLTSLRRLSEPAARAPAELELVPFLGQFLDEYRYDIERRGIVVAARPFTPGLVAVDPEALAQVLLDHLGCAVQRLGQVEEPLLEISATICGDRYRIELAANGRAAEEGRELPFNNIQLGPRGEDYRLILAISRQILLQMGALVVAGQEGPESWVSRIELPLARRG